ncbi:MAG: hypothetical protein ACI8UO_004242 [Verrucomicrobiales bacterium]|jgi:hypothetical protein
MRPTRFGWILLVTPLVIWLAFAGLFWKSTLQAERDFKQEHRLYDLETKLVSAKVFVTRSGERYHDESHQVGKTTAISHFQAQERDLTPCLVCRPLGERRYPNPPEPPVRLANRTRTISFAFGFVPLTWIVLTVLLPIPIREYYMRWR